MNTNAQRAFVGALVLLTGGAALWHFSADPQTPAPQRSTAQTSMAVANDFIRTGHALPPSASHTVLRFSNLQEYETVSRFGRLPNSLSGANITWNLAANAKGKLILSADLAALFEFFLSAHTEEGLATSLGRIEEYLRGQLPEGAAAEALDILRNYLAYKQGLTRFEPSTFTGNAQDAQMATVADVKAAMDRRSASRRQYLGAEVADVFFRADEAYDAYTIRRLEIQANTTLSAADREAQILQAEQLLTPEKRARVQQERREAELNQRIAALQAQGGNNEEAIRKLRTEVFGAQEAQRLAVVEQEQAAWMQRLQSYRSAKDGIQNQTAWSPDAKALAVEELEKSRFSPDELREVRILESIRTQSTQGTKPTQPG